MSSSAEISSISSTLAELHERVTALAEGDASREATRTWHTN